MVRQQDVFEFLKRDQASKFHLIFADPPYEKTKSGERFTEKLLANEQLPGLLEPSGVLILEKHPEESLPEAPLWQVGRAKRYGATEVLFLSAIRSPVSEM